MSDSSFAGRDAAAPADVQPGDLVCTGQNLFPVYRVVAVQDDQAWIRDETGVMDYIVRKDRCRLATRP